MFRKALIALTGPVLLISACAKDNDTPPAAAPTAYPQAYPAQPGATAAYPQPAVTTAQPLPAATVPPATPAPGATAPATAGTMATPNAFALPCQNDQACGFARCNMQFQKCAFPCQSAVDCGAGNSCNTATGLCLPGAAPQ